MNKHILIADDDPHIRDVLAFALAKSGIKTSQAKNGAEALLAVQKMEPDLVILDVAMPEMDGLEVCRQLRKNNNIPILFLSSRDEEIDKIVGLEIGGDDYVTKPFSPREVVARVSAILKRNQAVPVPKNAVAETFKRGIVTLDTNSYSAFCELKTVPLTATEFMLLLTFFKRPEKVFTRDELMDQSYDNIIVSDRTIDSHIRRIRAKFKECGIGDIIVTSHGIGYRLGACQP